MCIIAFRVVTITYEGSIILAFHVFIIFMTSFLLPSPMFHSQKQGPAFSFGTCSQTYLQSSRSVGSKTAVLPNPPPHTHIIRTDVSKFHHLLWLSFLFVVCSFPPFLVAAI